MGSETLHIIYYLSREGMLEEPHLLEVACNGGSLHLIDVKRWLMLTRGNSMPASFSWSFKRNYKEGCIWQDLSADEDLILPSSEGEYILKGSKFVVAPKEAQWSTPTLAEEPNSTTTSPMYTKYDCISVIGDVRQMNTEITNGEDSCSLTLSDHSQKSDNIYDMEHIHVDQSTMGSSCVMVNDHLLMNSNVSILQSTHEVADDAKENGEIKLHGDPEGNAALPLLHDQLATLSTAMVLQATQLASDTHKKLLELSIAKKASSYQVADKCRMCGPPSGATSNNADLVLMSRATAKPADHNVCNAHAGDTEEQACPYAESVQKDIDYKTDVSDLHAANTEEPQTQACPSAENRQLSRSKYTKSKNSLNPLHWASCMAEDSNVIDIQGKPLNRCSNNIIHTQRSIKTKWGCSHTPVLPSHVKVNSLGNTSAHKPPVPCSTERNNHIFEGITSGIQYLDKKVCSKRVTYSDQLGVELPATMSLSNVTGQKSAPIWRSSQQRLAPWKTTVGSSHKSAYRHKNATSRYLQKKTSLPVFGSENQQHQPFEELDWFGIDSTRNVSIRALEPPHYFYTHQDSKFPTHDYHDCGKFHGRQHHDHAELTQSRANLSTKILWEELLQTTQQVFTSQETI